MFYTKYSSMLKYFVSFSMIATLAACSSSNDGPVFDPDVQPQNVQVVSGDSSTTDVQNTISWTLDPTATGYVVYVGDKGSVDENSSQALPAPSGSNSVTHSGIDVVAGIALYYKVQAVSGTQTSVLSSEVTGTPQEILSGIDPGNNLNDVAWNGFDTLVAVGDSGVIISSADGTADPWEDAADAVSPAVVSLSAVTWEGTTNNHFIIVGADGTVLTGSVSNWTSQPTPVAADLEDVKWMGNGYIAVGKESTVITSNPEGSIWSEQSLPAQVTNVTFNGVASNGSRIVAVGTNGTLLTSTNMGVDWTPWTVTENNHLNDVTWDGSQFIVVGSTGTIYTSTDGADWQKSTRVSVDSVFIGVTQWDSSVPTDPIPAIVGATGDFIVFPDATTELFIRTGTTEQLSANTWVSDGVNPDYFVIVGHDGFVLTSQRQ